MSIDRLRAEVRKRERATRRKLARNENKGINLAGSEFDPLRERGDVDSLNTRQLRSYLKQLNSFMSRSNQYDAGLQGAPLPRDMVREYKRLEQIRNRNVRKHVKTISDVYIEPQGMTVGQREATVQASRFNILRAGGTPGHKPYDEIERTMAGVTDAKALQKIIALVKGQTGKDFARQAVIAQRKAHAEFLERHGSVAQAKKIRRLTLRQFDILKNYTDYGRLNEFRYLKGTDSGRKYQDFEDDASSSINELIDWVKTI